VEVSEIKDHIQKTIYGNLDLLMIQWLNCSTAVPCCIVAVIHS